MKYGPDYRAEHVLADGTRITVGHIRPDDKDELKRQFARLSPSTRYLRFLATGTELTDEVLRYLTEVDGDSHVALVAVTDSHDLKSEVGLGVARFVRLTADPTVAETAVTVVDDYQHRGIGRILVESLGEAALERGVKTFRAEILAANMAVRALLAESGAVVVEDQGETLVLDVSLEAQLERFRHEPGHPMRQLLRIIAGAIQLLREAARPRPALAVEPPKAGGR